MDTEDTRAVDMNQLDDKRELQKIFNSLSELSRKERDVVLLRVFEEFNEQEAATIMGVKKGTVKSLLHRGLSKLQHKHKHSFET